MCMPSIHTNTQGQGSIPRTTIDLLEVHYIINYSEKNHEPPNVHIDA